MVKYLFFLVLLLSLNVQAEVELVSDKERIKFTRTAITTLEDGSLQATYNAGLDGKKRLLDKIKDVADLDNLEYTVEEAKTNKNQSTLKITFKNGLLLEEVLKALPERLP